MKIFESENFVVESHERPEVDRLDGGHIKIFPKKDFADRTELPPELAHEMMDLSIATAQAFRRGMAKQGVELGRINFQENGNWKPHLHLHLYGRALDARWQKFGEPIIPGHKVEYQALTEADVVAIRSEFGK